MELTGFVPLLKRWWWLLLAATALAGATAYFVASRLPPTYEAEVRLLTGPINTDYGTLRASGELARTYSELATSRPLLSETAREVGVRRPVEELQKEAVSATANEVTRLVTIRIRDEDRDRAATFANRLAARLTQLTARVPQQQTEAIDELMRQREIASLPEGREDDVRTAVMRIFGTPYAGRLEIVDPATAPTEAVAPRISLITVLAALAGLLAAAALVLVREFSRDTVESEEELVALVPVPILGSVNGRRRREALVVEAVPDSPAADAYRLLATRIGFSDSGRPVRTLLVVGSEEGDGSGILAANLAAVLAQSNVHVTLVDANTAKGEITSKLGLDGRPGYRELVAHADSLEVDEGEVERLRIAHNENLDVVPLGTPSGSGLLLPDSAQRILNRLLTRSDLVVVNAPSVDRSSTLVWARFADATTLVVHRGRTGRDDLTQAAETLRQVGANLIGTIVREEKRLLPLR